MAKPVYIMGQSQIVFDNNKIVPLSALTPEERKIFSLAQQVKTIESQGWGVKEAAEIKAAASRIGERF